MNSQLIQNNYLVVPNFIPSEYAEELGQMLLDANKTNLCTQGDGQAPRSPSFYNFLPLVKLLVKKVPTITEIIEEEVLPTYVYARTYVNGEVLNRHRDREACEISVTLNLKKDIDWPIWIQKPSGEEVSVSFKPGDAMVYLGKQADHWRNMFMGRTYVQTFLHYVRADGEFAYTVFDKRQ